MMHREEPHVLLLAEPYQRASQQRTAVQIERPPGFFSGEPLNLGLLLVPGQLTQVHHRERQSQGRSDNLNRTSIHYRKGRPQGFMALHDFVKTAFQSGRVKRSLETDGGGNIVGGVVRRQSIDEPQALLRKRERQVSVARDLHYGRRLQIIIRTTGCLDAVGQAGHGRNLEQPAQWHFDAEGVTYSGNYLSG